MPKDNHSLMQLYLDGPNKYFYTFFNVLENRNIKIKNDSVLNTHKFLKNLSIEKIKQSQMIATEKVFISKKIPFRSFRILKRNEQSLGELFCFFILETILLGRALNVNPFDQPSVELIKIETKKIFLITILFQIIIGYILSFILTLIKLDPNSSTVAKVPFTHFLGSLLVSFLVSIT